MKIETKFEVGQKVCYLKGVKINEAPIHSIKVEIEKENKINTIYFFRHEKNGVANFDVIDDEKVFETKEEFLNQLDLTE